MSSRDRMLAALTRRAPDHVPFSPYVSQGPRWEKPLYWRNQLERAQRMLELGLDPVIDIWLPSPQVHPDVTIKTFRDTSGSEPLLTKEYHTPAGVLRETLRETADWCSVAHQSWIPCTFGTMWRTQFNIDLFDDYSVSRRTEPWVKGPEDLEKIKYVLRMPEGHVLDEWRMDAERAMEFAGKYDLLTVSRRSIVGDASLLLCDVTWFLCQLCDEPDFVTEFLGILQKWALGLTELALQVGVDLVQRRGWYEIPAYWGLKHFQKFILPLVEEETKLVHQADKLHCYLVPEGQGTYAPIMKDMSFDVLMGIDPRMLQGGDMKSLGTELGDRKSFWGGVDAEVTLQSENPDHIDRAVREAVESLATKGGLVLSACTYEPVSLKSMMLLIEAWRKYGKFLN